MNCNFIEQEGRLVCTRCGVNIKFIPGKVLRNCDAGPKPELPSITEQVVHFASDMTKWAASGFAITDQSEKDRRLSICQGCEKYTGTRCSECGCQCSWASWLETKDCPLGKWKKEQQ